MKENQTCLQDEKSEGTSSVSGSDSEEDEETRVKTSSSQEDEEDEGLFEILIEALTGTTFRVRVSPWETGTGLKTLLQSTEGIPASQQHLLFGEKELMDDTCLLDQGVAEGSTLRLVLAMKGGPINQSRYSTSDEALWKEVTEYMDNNREEIWENVPGGRTVTVLILREGDSINLYRVIENDDGSFSSLDDSWNSSKSKERACERGRTAENARLKEKLSDLMTRMEASKQKKQQKKRKPKTSFRVRSARSRLASAPLLLQDDLSSSTRLSTPSISGYDETRMPSTKMSSRRQSLRGTPRMKPKGIILDRHSFMARGSVMLEGLPHSNPPMHVDFNKRKPLDAIKAHTGRTRVNTVEDRMQNGKRKMSRQEVDPLLNFSIGLPRGINSPQNLPRRQHSVPLYMIPNKPIRPRGSDPLHKSHNCNIFKEKKEKDIRPNTSPEVLEKRPGTATDFIQLKEPDISLRNIVTILNTSRSSSRQSSHHGDSHSSSIGNLLNGIATSLAAESRSEKKRKQNSVSLSMSSLKSRVPSPLAMPTPGIGALATAGNKEQRKILQDLINLQNSSSFSRNGTPESFISKKPSSGRRNSQSPSTAAVVVSKRRSLNNNGSHRHPRCNVCRKKLGIVNSYNCRCSGLFCAQHRYPESHSCSYDFKSEGKKFLEMTNPLVAPQKLPKI